MRLLREDEIHVRVLEPGGVPAVLAAYLGRAVEAGEIHRSPLGKPCVRGADFEFSVSHTRGCTVVAVARRTVGIDVEAVEALPGLESLARVSLAPDEQRAMAALPTAERARWYYRCWVRKEALLKARGCGLTLDPREIDTTRCVGAWRWHDATLAPDVAMSIATADPHARLVITHGAA